MVSLPRRPPRSGCLPYAMFVSQGDLTTVFSSAMNGLCVSCWVVLPSVLREGFTLLFQAEVAEVGAGAGAGAGAA